MNIKFFKKIKTKFLLYALGGMLMLGGGLISHSITSEAGCAIKNGACTGGCFNPSIQCNNVGGSSCYVTDFYSGNYCPGHEFVSVDSTISYCPKCGGEIITDHSRCLRCTRFYDIPHPHTCETPVPFTISFNVNLPSDTDTTGVTAPADASYANKGAYITVSTAKPSVTNISGYTFEGWYTAASGGTLVSDCNWYGGTATFYAHWTPNTYTIVYHPQAPMYTNGCTPTVSTYSDSTTWSATVTYNQETTLATSIPFELIGYKATIKGWHYGSTSGTTVTTWPAGKASAASSGSLKNAIYKDNSKFFCTNNGTIHLYFNGTYTQAYITLGVTDDVTGGAISSNGMKVPYRCTYNNPEPAAGSATITYRTNGGSMKNGLATTTTLTLPFSYWGHDTLTGVTCTQDSAVITNNYPGVATYNLVAYHNSASFVTGEATMSGSEFRYWVLDGAGTQYNAGVTVVTNKSMTLAALYETPDIILTTTNDYSSSVNEGKGAVNLSWVYSGSSEGATYIPYVSGGIYGNSWYALPSDSSVGASLSDQTWSYSALTDANGVTLFTAPATGIYSVTLSGGAGGNKDTVSGGAGRTLSFSLYLEKDQTVKYNTVANDEII